MEFTKELRELARFIPSCSSAGPRTSWRISAAGYRPLCNSRLLTPSASIGMMTGLVFSLWPR